MCFGVSHEDLAVIGWAVRVVDEVAQGQVGPLRYQIGTEKPTATPAMMVLVGE